MTSCSEAPIQLGLFVPVGQQTVPRISFLWSHELARPLPQYSNLQCHEAHVQRRLYRLTSISQSAREMLRLVHRLILNDDRTCWNQRLLVLKCSAEIGRVRANAFLTIVHLHCE